MTVTPYICDMSKGADAQETFAKFSNEKSLGSKVILLPPGSQVKVSNTHITHRAG